jgi:Spy/CpxP family protein refolding chaperone
MGAESRRLHILSGVVMIATFLLGGVTGFGLALWTKPGGRPPHRPPPPGMRGGGLPPYLHELDLSPDQERQARAIVEKYRPELDAVVRATFPKVREINDEIDADLAKILTPAQLERMKELRARGPGPPPPGEEGPPGGPPPTGSPPPGPR